MISQLARIGLPQAVGIYFEGPVVHASRVASSPLGPVEVAHHSEPVNAAEPQEAVARLIRKMRQRGGERLPVAIGLPIDQTFFATRLMQASGGDASPRVLLREALRSSSSVSLEEMLVDVVRSQPGARRLASIVACKRDLVEQLVEPLTEGEAPVLHVEPAACALLRCAGQYDRRSKAVCRVFLSQTHLLAVLAVKNQPLLWRQTHMPKGDEAATILAAIRSLTTIAEQSGLETTPEAIVVHGRADLRRLLDMEWVHQQAEVPFFWLDAPGFDPAKISFGLAQRCLDDDGRGFDLARTFKSSPPLWRLFPWREAALHVAMIAILALFLCYRLAMVKDAHAAASIRNAQSQIASLPMQQLQKEKKDLQQRVTAVQKFLNNRIVWTNYQRDLAASLPDNVFLTSVRGSSELATKGKSKTKPSKKLVLKGAVSLAQDGLIPHEVDRLLNALREHPTFTSDFDVIELSELKQFEDNLQGQTLAMFTIVCSPKRKKS